MNYLFKIYEDEITLWQKFKSECALENKSMREKLIEFIRIFLKNKQQKNHS